MAKPRGSFCNLVCEYCFLSRRDLYPGSRFHMPNSVLEGFTRHISAQRTPQVNFGWQGGEPTLLGVGFYDRAVEFQRNHAPNGVRVPNALQTNGTLRDDEWCRFLKDNDFLVGISLDSPRELHDRYRVDIDVFDEWGRRDVGRVFVQLFDVALAAWVVHTGISLWADPSHPRTAARRDTGKVI